MARRFSAGYINLNTGASGGTYTAITYAAILKASSTAGTQIPIGISAGGLGNGLRFSSGVIQAYANFGSYGFTGNPAISTSDNWVLVAITKPAGTATARAHKYVFDTDTWTRADSSGAVPNSSSGNNVLTLGAAHSSRTDLGFAGDIAVAAIFADALMDDQVGLLPFSLMSWHALNPSALWVLDQSDTAQAVVDLTGRGANQTASSGSTVSPASVPIFSYGHPVIAPTRVATPPWLNQSSGVAARNGTASHTINFGFTSTSGSLLVAVVYGGVTHTASGWTGQLQPVSSGELSVFTKTSSGDTSIAVTHNGSNYPVGWTVYEFAAGSSYTSGTGSNLTGTDTLPTLSGLPGTDQTIIAALGRVSSASGITSASAVWTSPATEDADLFDAYATTDGMFLTVGHQSTSATSATPTVTPTYGGTGTPNDRQAVVFAISPTGGGPAPETGTVTATLPTLTAAASGNASAAGTATAALPALTAAAAGTVSTSGTAAGTLPALTASAACTVGTSGTATVALPTLQTSASGTASASGNSAVTLPALTGAGSGTASATGAASTALPALQAAATGVSGGSGTAGIGLPALTATASGTASTSGTTAGTLPALTGQSTGTVSTTGSATLTLPSLTATASGTATVNGTTTATLPALGVAAAGTASASGTSSATLPALQAAIVGTVAGATSGGITVTLPALTGAATGTASSSGAVSGQLPAVGAQAAGIVQATTAIAGTLGALQTTVSGTVTATGSAAGALPALTAAITGGSAAPSGIVTVGLPALVAAANGQVTGTGQITATLPALTATASDAPVFKRRPGTFTAGTTRSRLAAGTLRGPTYLTGG